MTASVAIIIPIYNVAGFLEEAIRSAVSQDYPHIQVAVINDGSEPEHSATIREICGRFPSVQLYEEPHRGTAATRDAGVAHTMSDFIIFLDADDVLLPGAVSFLASALIAHPEATVCYGRYQIIDEHGNVTSEIRPPLSRMVSGKDVLRKLLMLKLPFFCGSMCMRRSAITTIKVMNHSLIFGEDWVLWCHLALKGHIIPAGDRIVLHYRKHDNNVTGSYAKNPDPVFKTYDTIFKDPIFIEAFSKEEVALYEEECLNYTHMRLAGYFASQGDTKKAQRHFEKMTLPPTVFMEKRKE